LLSRKETAIGVVSLFLQRGFFFYQLPARFHSEPLRLGCRKLPGNRFVVFLDWRPVLGFAKSGGQSAVSRSTRLLYSFFEPHGTPVSGKPCMRAKALEQYLR